MKAVNIEAAKELIKKYRSFSVKDIKNAWLKEVNGLYHYGGKGVARLLTGFGKLDKCLLCVASTERKRISESEPVPHDCSACIYGGWLDCMHGQHEKSYYEIQYAKSPYKLWLAFRRRANHIEKYLKTL